MSDIYAPSLVEERATQSVTTPTGVSIDASNISKPLSLLAEQFNKSPTEVAENLATNPLVDMPITVPKDAVAQTVKVSNKVTEESIPQQGQALLNVIAMYESAGDYNVIVGKGKSIPGTPGSFESYAEHPRVIGMRTSAGPSTAAGRYQITASTWDSLRAKYPDLTDFSPRNQDKAAWRLAQTDYGRRTGRDLLGDLSTGRTQDIGNALRSTWTGLAGQNISGNLASLLGGR
jgi:muramidase (phage lysozyme)